MKFNFANFHNLSKGFVKAKFKSKFMSFGKDVNIQEKHKNKIIIKKKLKQT